MFPGSDSIASESCAWSVKSGVSSVELICDGDSLLDYWLYPSSLFSKDLGEGSTTCVFDAPCLSLEFVIEIDSFLSSFYFTPSISSS